ncbi:MAG: xanthine dehydrogenase family protein subunit M [Planctomycetes bacterium]|nr:xanthine dehydrogenase family protein subunit M [Planctomycetota bacterium]
MRAFDWIQPKTLDQVLELLPGPRDTKQRDRVKLLAGGQDLLGELKEYLVQPEQVVDLKSLPGLAALEFAADGGITISALVTLAALESSAELRTRSPMIAEAAGSVASVQIRNQGTVGGNLCQRPRCWYYRREQALCIKKGGAECFAYGGLNKYNAILGGGPSYIVHPSDLAPALVAAGASAVIRGKKGERRIELERFFTLPSEGSVLRENVLAPDELLLRVEVPPQTGWRSTYLKFRERSSYDFALSAVALALKLDGGTVREARIVLGGVAPIPWRADKAEAALVGKKIDDASCKQAAELALVGAEALQYNGYKIPLTQALITKALRKLS